MPSWCVTTMEYDVELKSLFARRLCKLEADHSIIKRGKAAFVTVRGESALRLMAEASILVLCRDLQYFALAKMVDRLPLPLCDKQDVLTQALRSARSNERLDELIEPMADYLKDTRDLCVDGYLQFRLRPCLLMWELCVSEAATEVLMKKQYEELKGVLLSLTETAGTTVGELQLCIHSDGTCTLTDERLVRIEYVDCSVEGIVTLLVNMAPRRLVVYDLTGGHGEQLTEAISRVFSGRVKIYK